MVSILHPHQADRQNERAGIRAYGLPHATSTGACRFAILECMSACRSGVAQWLACWAHNPKVRGSKPRSAILNSPGRPLGKPNTGLCIENAHAGSRTRVTSMGGLYDAATLHAPLFISYWEPLQSNEFPIEQASVAMATVPLLDSNTSGVAQWLACWAHNPKVRGSKPRSANVCCKGVCRPCRM